MVVLQIRLKLNENTRCADAVCNFVQEQKRNLQVEMSEQKLKFLLCIYAL